MANKAIVRNLLIDEPTNQDSFRGGGHDRVAFALSTAIENFHDDDRAIGLDGPWGSGKSTVVEIAKRNLSAAKTSGGIGFHFFTYDIWKSQGSAFRRSFLEHFLFWARESFPKKTSQLDEIEKKIKGKIRKVTSNNENILDWYGVFFLLFVPFVPILYFWAKSEFDGMVAAKNLSGFLSTYPFLIIVAFVVATLAWSLVKYFENGGKAGERSLKRAISQTLLLSAKHYENQKITQHIREVDPNDFEFQQILREILSTIQSKTRKVIVVLDNIDRLPKDEIVDHWALVRAVFSRGGVATKNAGLDAITAIVPFDRSLIEQATGADSDEDASQRDDSKFSRREIFSKTFDEILFVSPPVMSNSRDFFRQKVSEALPNFKENDALYRVYSIFSDISRDTKGQATPRQIIAFINELSGLYALHSGKFALPSVAAFIAYQDELSSDPTALSGGLVSPRIRSIAGDPELDRNLAAMAFNVDADLAFQVLLDERIADATLSSSPNALRDLSKSPGFDLRVHDVIFENINDWIVSDDLGAIVGNFVAILSDYDGESKSHIVRTLSKGIANADGLSVSENTIEPYLGILELADISERRVLTKALFEASLSNSTKAVRAPAARGKQLVETLAKIVRKVESEENEVQIVDIQGGLSIPTQPMFVFGMSVACAQSHLNFENFAIDEIDLPDIDKLDEENEHPFLDKALGDPAETLIAFQLMKKNNILPSEHLLYIAKKVHEKIIEFDVDEDDGLSELLTLFGEIYIWLDGERRKEIVLSEIFDEDDFFENLEASNGEDGGKGFAYAIFLSRIGSLEEELPAPLVLQPNGQRVRTNTDAFDWFAEYREGSKELEEDQYALIADLVRRSLTFTSWLSLAATDGANAAHRRTVEAGLSGEKLPYIPLDTFLSHFDYVNNNEQIDTVQLVGKFSPRIQSKELRNLKLSKVPCDLIEVAKRCAGWESFLEKVRDLLCELELADWQAHLAADDAQFRLLTAAIEHLDFTFEGDEGRRLIIDFVVGSLAGELSIASEDGAYDSLLKAIPQSFYGEIFRQIREEMHNVNGSRLERLGAGFPAALSSIVSYGSRITKSEKDAIVRHIVAVALEAENRIVLHEVVALGHPRVSDYIRSSEDSTQDKLKGAWKVFSNSCRDKEFVRDVGEAIHGKRKAKSIFEILWG